MKFTPILISGGTFRLLIDLPFHDGYKFRVTITDPAGNVLDVMQKRFTADEYARYSSYFDTILAKANELFPRGS